MARWRIGVQSSLDSLPAKKERHMASVGCWILV